MNIAALHSYCEQSLAELAQIMTVPLLEEWYRKHLSRNGELQNWKKGIGQVPKEERPLFGKEINTVAQQMETTFFAHQESVKLMELNELMSKERIDVTLPARHLATGGYHPLQQTLREVYQIFQSMGFVVFDAPHVELDEYNFQKLNIPPSHPARDMQDTFYVSEDVVLRTHTSPGQIRAMEQYGNGGTEPVQVILPGLCYRNETITARSEVQFHQVEGLLVSENVRMSDLKGILLRFARAMFGENQEIRFRGSYFPFTEPSVEVDIKCTLCGGEGRRVCKHSGWLEILGAGLVHPFVLQSGGYDPSKFRGIAFGMGIERMVLLKHQIGDIRYFYQNDVRFLRQFR
ncbi:MAG: phenylalanine--tRNA ligase subunit alpha [Bacteroidia bacterium]